ncbi:tRNA pseudouridine(55) synthase TruB [Cerasibacillus terrae]|uniref:tRNA pseudouridine synthase B n=1 Tax=Cerasibacillus terrae TaxID=2498845 RepID=A0A5C8P2Y5_9BACI|nr:tRNA pseudouridine(55) synthase TruB [Cerasibacillus terrae]TXL67722.1 tRNA pseudouridine(55) synthase TruB [Cerasibacillus terrae]
MKGILPLWKPRGLTSHDCVAKIRKLYSTKKVGHTGTLDPQVEGVLPICIGQATKIVPYLTNTKKTYKAEVELGIATETEDAYGKVVEKMDMLTQPSLKQIDQVLKTFTGIITQVPPMYSAVKVKGKKLYEYARENKTVERPKREITIYELKRTSQYDMEKNRFSIEVICSKGTYIRTLCVDIGKTLGYPAHMSNLERSQSGSFSKENSITFDMIEKASIHNRQQELLIPILQGLDHLPIIEVNQEVKRRVLYGQKLPTPNEVKTKEPFVIIHEDEVLAIYQVNREKQDQIKAVRVFN